MSNSGLHLKFELIHKIYLPSQSCKSDLWGRAFLQQPERFKLSISFRHQATSRVKQVNVTPPNNWAAIATTLHPLYPSPGLQNTIITITHQQDNSFVLDTP